MLNIKRQAGVGDPCKVGRIYLTLDEADRAIYRQAIDDDVTWSAIRLETELRSRGIRVSNDTILQHRRGACQCEGWPNA